MLCFCCPRIYIFYNIWWGVGSLSCSLFYQYSLWSFSLNHYSNIVHSHHFLFQHFSISVCWRTTKCVMGKLPCCRERKCILDMDHHCPFIGNCVGAANHRSFIGFLISVVLSTIYVSIMSVYAGLHLWPPLTYSFRHINGVSGSYLAWTILNEIVVAFLRSALLLSSRGLILAYLFIASVSLQIGLTVLLWQQLSYIYEGKTYLSHLSSQGDNEEEKKDCQNIVRFFGLQYSITRFLPNFRITRKKHIK
uniref:S-acyltransferase n=1 Tax=Phaseolus vulgaris TaxID=3885 RepID=V7C4I5_PHAVU|nr:hypothetical protein PHAVU_003G006600g [Phaseolus vulgaris]XP_007153098.1 hypothetical protein PHAVU_003G006600g [Phaseolus vulgaris]ESW25091.1 hypothetical protein PHAVU_003G006600g [Phaseolus vulgaris]ESW25092.1 hypothetical protein PHAVU_003G006600g [Phaseolus vulgaris]